MSTLIVEAAIEFPRLGCRLRHRYGACRAALIETAPRCAAWYRGYAAAVTSMTRFGVPGALLPAVIPIAKTEDRSPGPNWVPILGYQARGKMLNAHIAQRMGGRVV